MPHIQRLEDAQIQHATVLTIGVFDGLHRGHQALIQQLVNTAHHNGHEAVVLTFFPHPDAVLHGQSGRYYLTTSDYRAELLLSMGVDWVVTHPFNDEIRQIRAADFVDRLIQHLRVQTLWVGKDFAMGYQREGNVAFLSEQGAAKGFTVQTIDLVEHSTDGSTITSTGIRAALQQGDMEQVRDWLGRSYAVQGMVMDGQKRGRTIGFPTANLQIWDLQLLPPNGVYACWITIGAERFMAMTNVGTRPTFNGDNITVEAYIMDFDRDIYGQTVHLSFEKRLRAEQKFNGIQELIAQITRDVAAGRDYLSGQAS